MYFSPAEGQLWSLMKLPRHTDNVGVTSKFSSHMQSMPAINLCSKQCVGKLERITHILRKQVLSKWASLNTSTYKCIHTHATAPPPPQKKRHKHKQSSIKNECMTCKTKLRITYRNTVNTIYTEDTQWQCDTKSTKVYLFDRPFSFKELKVSFNHLKLNITLLTKRKALKFFLITIYNSFCIKFQPKCQVLPSNLLRGCNSAVSRIKDKRSELAFMGKPSWRWNLQSSPHKNTNVKACEDWWRKKYWL